MKPLHSIAPLSYLPVPASAPAPTTVRVPTPLTRRAEIQRAWIAEARLVLGLDGDEVPARHQWLAVDADGTLDERNLAELGRWAMQLGAKHCRRAADLAATRYGENRTRKDARRRVERALRELRLYLTSRQRQAKRQRRSSLLSQLALVVDRYRSAHPACPETEIAAAVRELLAGIAAGRETAH